MRAFRIVLAAAAMVALTASAQAQMGQGMVSGNANRQNDRPGGAPPPQEKHAPRANDKDYKSSLNRLPDQKFDPWAKTR
jgi:hypothetical protein